MFGGAIVLRRKEAAKAVKGQTKGQVKGPVRGRVVQRDERPRRRIRGFFRDVTGELSRVNWPTRAEVVAGTVVVIIAVSFFAAFIGMIDLIFVTLIKYFSL